MCVCVRYNTNTNSQQILRSNIHTTKLKCIELKWHGANFKDTTERKYNVFVLFTLLRTCWTSTFQSIVAQFKHLKKLNPSPFTLKKKTIITSKYHGVAFKKTNKQKSVLGIVL